MKTLSKKQLAYLLDIKIEDARAKMCAAWEKENGIQRFADNTQVVANGEIIGATRNTKNKIQDNYPDKMEIDVLSRNLNMPDLQLIADDVQNNYLTRAATKKFILDDFPRKEIAKAKQAGKFARLTIPSGLRSIIRDDIAEEIKAQWKVRFPKTEIA